MRLLAVLLFASLALAQEKPQLVVQRGHGGSRITSLAWSADGRFLLTGSWDCTAVLWDVTTRKELRRFSGHTKGVDGVALSGDGRYAYTSSFLETTIRFWNVATGKEFRRLDEFTVVGAIAHSAGARRLAVPGGRGHGGDHTMEVLFFNERSGRVSGRIYHGEGFFVSRSSAYSADGRRILLSYHGSAVLYDAKGKRLQQFRHPQFGKDDSDVTAVALSADNRRALTSDDRGLVILWDAVKGGELQRFNVKRGGPVGFSPDGRLLLMGAEGAVYDTQTETRRFVLEKKPDPVGDNITLPGAFSPDGKKIAIARGGSVSLWSGATGEKLATFGSGQALGTPALDVSPDGRLLAVAAGGEKGGVLALWDMAGGGQAWSRPWGGLVSVHFSPHGRRLLAAGGLLNIYDLATLQRVGRLPVAAAGLSRARFAPDGERVATADPGVRVWRWDAKTPSATMTGGGLPAWSPDGRYVAGTNVGVRVWDAATGKQYQKFAVKEPSALVFYPDGKRLLIGEESGRCRAWNMQTARPVRVFKGHKARVTSARFSPDGKLLLTTSMDTTARIWNRRTGRLLVTLKGHTGWVREAAFVGGMRVITGGSDGTRVWDAKTGRQLCRLINFKDESWAVLDADGRFDASDGGDVDGLHWVYRDEPISLAQLKERYYDPGLLAKYLGYNPEPLREVAAFKLPKLFPMTTLQAPTEEKPSLGIKLEDRGGGIGRVVVKVNGKELTDDARGDKAGSKASKLYLEVPMTDDTPLMPGETNLLEVEVYNAEGYLRSRGMRATFKAPGEKSTAPPRLHAIVAGTADYTGEEIDLRYATKDAADFASALTVAASGLLGPKRVSVTLLRDAQRDELVKALKDARRKLKARDILVLYLAGHGVNVAGDDGDFFYLTREAASADLADPEVRISTGISSRQLTDLLTRIPALKQVLILDTCAAGGLIEKLTEKRNVPSSQIRALERLKDRTGLHILAGCAADRVSYEATRYAQGLLTHSLLLGMRGGALREDEFVDVLRLFNFTVDRVPQLAGSIGGIQRPVIASPKASASFDIGKLDDDAKEQVPLRTPRPLVLRTNFQDEDELEDVLNLAKLVDRRLNDASARGAEARLVFVDARALPDACRIAGRYRVADDGIEVDLRLSRGKEKLARFTVKGAKSDLDALAARIVDEITRRLP